MNVCFQGGGIGLDQIVGRRCEQLRLSMNTFLRRVHSRYYNLLLITRFINTTSQNGPYAVVNTLHMPTFRDILTTD